MADIFYLILVSVLIGGILTSYFEEYEKTILMPLRNLYIFGNTHNRYKSNNVIITKYSHGEGINPVHVAMTVRNSALKILELSVHQINELDIYNLLTTADFFIKTAHTRSYEGLTFYVWEYNFDYPYYGLTAPWISGMAQGHIIEILLAAYKVTDNPKYLKAARLAANTMRVKVENGGVAIEVGNGLWFEEYSHPNVHPPRVLNGHNFALNGLWYITQIDKNYMELFDKGVHGLKQLLPRFDAIIWSMYDLVGTPANRKYQEIHVKQLKELFERTGDKFFLHYSNKFKCQLWFPFSAFYRVIMYPNKFTLFILLSNVILVFILLLIVQQLPL